MDKRGLENVRRNHIIEAGTSTWYNGVGDEVGLRLEASGSGGVSNSFYLGQRAPSMNRNQYQVPLFPWRTYHSRRY